MDTSNKKGESIMMDYEEFKDNLQYEIQRNFTEHISFTSGTVNRTNGTAEGLSIRFDGEAVAPTIYPREMYREYQRGMSVRDIAGRISDFLRTVEYPEIPGLTPENAKKCVSLSLVNKDANREMLKGCPYKEVYDMAAVPRWHISDSESFIVNDKVLQSLKMTKEEIMEAAQKNTESAGYTCRSLDMVLRESMLNNGVDEEVIDEIMPCRTQAYVLSSPSSLDGSCAVLSDSFMQEAAGQIGAEGLYLLPSSRHEMIALDAGTVDDPGILKAMLMEVNSRPEAVGREDFLSDSVYRYDTLTHSLSVCGSMGIFHGKNGINRENGSGRRMRGI